MRTVYGKLIALIMAITFGLLMLLPMRFGQEDNLYASPHSLRLNKGDTYNLSYALDADYAQTVSYTALDENVVTVSPQGVVRAVNPGTTEIRMNASGGAKTTVHVEVNGSPTKKLTLNTDSLRMEKGQVTGLSATFNAGADDTRLEWRSENPEIASVDAAGRVTALRGGSTKVCAVTPGGLKAEADVFVHVPGESMRIVPENLTVGTGAAVRMGAEYSPDDTTDTVARWVTSDERLLTVDADGTIHAVGVGEPVLTVYSEGGLSNSAIIHVERSSERFELYPAEAAIERGESIDLQTVFLNAEGIPDNASANHLIEWRSSNPKVATVDAGHVEGLSSGTAVISATVDGMTAYCALRVQVLVHEITLNEYEMYMLRPASATPIQLVAEVYPDDPDDPTITWETSNDIIATVDQNGLVTLTGAYGTAIITARAASGAEAQFSVSVVVKLPELAEDGSAIVSDELFTENGQTP